jgi:hypothetical protein
MAIRDAQKVVGQFQNLLDRQDTNGAFLVLKEAIGRVQSASEWATLGEVIQKIPESLWQTQPTWAALVAKLVTCTGQRNPDAFFQEAIGSFTIQQAPELWLEWAFELYLSQKIEMAKKILSDVLPLLSGYALATAWRRLGLTQAYLNQSDWKNSFHQALKLLPFHARRLRGQVLLDQATCAYTNGYTLEARDLASKAVGLLSSDAVLRTRCRILQGVIISRFR